MYEVLTAVDEDADRARAQARAISKLPHAGDIHVTVLHVFSGSNPEGASVGDVAAVRRAREILVESGIEVSLEETSGNPADEILDTAIEDDVDLITVSGRRRSPAGKALFGSTSQEVLLNADRPVLFCGVNGGD